jgi:hypothetical protein
MTDLAMQKEFVQGADNTWHHHRTPMPLKEQPAPLMNRDTVYSFAILDGKGDVAITLPENDGRYMSLHVMEHNHITYKVFYGPSRYLLPHSRTQNCIAEDSSLPSHSTDSTAQSPASLSRRAS